jgi:hypothetical protein
LGPGGFARLVIDIVSSRSTRPLVGIRQAGAHKVGWSAFDDRPADDS